MTVDGPGGRWPVRRGRRTHVTVNGVAVPVWDRGTTVDITIALQLFAAGTSALFWSPVPAIIGAVVVGYVWLFHWYGGAVATREHIEELRVRGAPNWNDPR